MATDEPLDSSDLDALEDLKRSRGYDLVRERILGELKARAQELETDVSEARTAALRGYIRALRVVLALPEILIDEISKTLENKG
jgi:hypothetical protein